MTLGRLSAVLLSTSKPASRKACICQNMHRRHLATPVDSSLAIPDFLAPRPKVTKRPLRKDRKENPGYGARLPKLPDPSIASKVYFPNFIITLARNGPAHAADPYTATFKVPLQLTKPDIVSFLTSVYGLQMTGIRTIIYRGKIRRIQSPMNTRKRRTPFRDKSFKKAIVQLTRPFWFPEVKSDEWWNEHYGRDEGLRRQQAKLKGIGHRAKPGYDTREPRYRGSSSEYVGMDNKRKHVQPRRAAKRRAREEVLMNAGREESARL